MMHNRSLGQVLAVACLSLGLSAITSACGDDESPDTGSTGGSGGTATGGSGGTATGGSGGTATGGSGGTAGSAGDGGAGKCNNDSDLAAIEKTYTSENKTVSQVASSCAVSCISDSDVATCMTQCVLTTTDNALSSECAGCYTTSALCAKDNCLAPCVVDPASEACSKCRCGDNAAKINCVDDLFTGCSGVSVDTCK